MKALGLSQGDEVITTAHSWISTSETITQAGGRVVFVDTEEDTFTIDPLLIEQKITPRTKGIIPVHLFGQPADMEPITKIAKKHGLWVIEDCAQAHLSNYRGKMVGTLGDVASFSFYPGKNLGAYGDAGAIITDDSALAHKMTCFARHGGLRKGEHEIEGINSRLDGIQAAVLSVKLQYLANWTIARQKIGEKYTLSLDGVGDIVTPVVRSGGTHVYHLYVIKTKTRDLLAKYLKSFGIPTVINYPTALPFLKAYQYLGHSPADFPIAYGNQSDILSLPIYPELTDEQFDYIVKKIKSFYAAGCPNV
jgi:dTDP-4-amino-4,6-dideoxygalactose transaminase